VAIVSISISLASCSAGTGTGTTSSQGKESSTSTSTPADSPTPAKTAKPPQVEPDLVGQSYDDALRFLSPYNVRITKKSKIAADTPGTVIAQEPVGGSPFSQSITLTLSVSPPAVPDVKGKTFDEAERQLKQLGFTLVEEPVFEDERTDGYVSEQSPPAGTENAGQVKLTVVRHPVVAYLADKAPVSKEVYQYNVGSAKANGQAYSHAMSIGAYGSNYSSSTSTPPAVVEFDLSREYRKLVTEIALEDRSSSDANQKVEIYADGRQLAAETLTFGQTKALSLDVTKALRLRISVTSLTGSGTVVFGDAKVQGLQSEVSTTTPSPSQTS